jgi:hypothetical protein
VDRLVERAQQVAGRQLGVERPQCLDDGRARGRAPPCPPKPSATASSRAPAYAESSLFSRTLPMSDFMA